MAVNIKRKENLNTFWNSTKTYNSIVMSIEEAFNESRVYEIPLFQRKYVWDKSKVKELMQDALDFYKANEKFFAGSILIKRDPGSTSYKIIDGQQRMSTIIFLLAIIDKFIDSKSILHKKIRTILDRDLSFPISLRLLDDQNDLKKLVEKSDDQNIKNKKIKEIKKIINNIKDDKIKITEIANSLLKIEISVINIFGENVNEYFAFESLNAKGIPLKVSQLLRNEIYSISKKFGDDNNIVKRRNKIADRLDKISELSSKEENKLWAIQLRAFKFQSDWLSEQNDRRLKKYPVETWKLFSVIKKIFSKGNNNKIKLFEKYEVFINSYFILYEYINNLENDWDNNNHKETKSYLKYVFDAKQTRPMLIIYLLKNKYLNIKEETVIINNSNYKKLLNFLKILCKSIISIHLMPSTLHKILVEKEKEIIKKLLENSYSDNDFIDILQFKPSQLNELKEENIKDNLKKVDFYKISSKTFIMKQVENNLSDITIWPYGRKRKGISDSVPTIDHLISRNSLDKKLEAKKFNNIDWTTFENNYLNKIGNLSLSIDDAGNKAFKEKIYKGDFKTEFDLKKLKGKYYTLKDFELRQEKLIDKIHSLLILGYKK